MKQQVQKYIDAIRALFENLPKATQDLYNKQLAAIQAAEDGAKVEIDSHLQTIIDNAVSAGDAIEKDAEAVREDAINAVSQLKQEAADVNTHVEGWIAKLKAAAVSELHKLVLHFHSRLYNMLDYFKQHPDNEFWFTNDGQCFRSAQEASYIASTLYAKSNLEADKQVTYVHRTNLLPVVTVTAGEATATVAEGSGSEQASEQSATAGDAKPSEQGTVNNEQETADIPTAQMIDHEVTQDDLDKNPDLVADGVKVGDVIQIAVEEGKDESTEVADAVKNKTVKKK